MKPDLKINFVDFWEGFIKTNNFFYNLLARNFNIIISSDPDILFYSCYGREYLQFTCIRIFYTAENVRPDFTGCDYALTFDHLKRPNHYRLPLYGLYINHLYFSGSRSKTLEELTKYRSSETLHEIWSKKRKFCCMVVSNPKSKKRLNFFKALSMIEHVDSGGRAMNNIGTLVHDKLSFISQYKFVIAFENESYPGYTTEKLIEPMFTDCIPIYWGNSEVQKDFNPNRFINYSDFKSDEDLINKIMKVNNDTTLAIQMLEEPVFPENKIPECIREENVLQFLLKIVANKHSIKPVAQTFKRSFHIVNRKKTQVINLINARLGLDKR